MVQDAIGVDAPPRPRPDAHVLGCLDLPPFEGEPARAGLPVDNAGAVLWESIVTAPNAIEGVVLASSGDVYASSPAMIHRILADGTYVEGVSTFVIHETSGLPAITDFGEVIALGAGLSIGFDGAGRPIGTNGSSGEGDRLGGSGYEADISLRGALGYASRSDGAILALNVDLSTNTYPVYGAQFTEPSHYGAPLRFGIGNLLAISTGFESDFLDADTGQPLGRLVGEGGLAVEPWLPTGDGRLLAAPHSPTRPYVIAFDHCGVESWRWVSERGHPTPRLISFDGAIIVRTRVDVQPWSDAVAVLDRDGQLVSGPRAGYDPLLVGADGTLYARACTLQSTSRVVALDQNLDELWSVDVGRECPANAALSDGGVLYVGAETGVLAIQTTSPGLAPTLWPSLYHDNRNTNWVLP